MGHEVRKDVVRAGPESDLLRSANEHLPIGVQREDAELPNRFRRAFVRVLARFRAHFVTRRRFETTTVSNEGSCLIGRVNCRSFDANYRRRRVMRKSVRFAMSIATAILTAMVFTR